MKHKTFVLSCADHACQQLAHILQEYAQAAYPPGGSECAQATRESLLQLADTISHAENSAENHAGINSRQRPFLKSAINWYYEDVIDNPEQHALLLDRLKRR